MKLLLLFSFVSVCFTVTAQSDKNIVIGKIDSIASKILNEKRKIWVHVPGAAGQSIYSQKKYPVVYLLDGDGHFSSVVGMMQQLTTVNGNSLFPEMIVVGIPNTNRMRDLTPSHMDIDPPMFTDSAFLKTSGGGEKFFAFMEQELIPYIEKNYSTEPYRILIGHSLGGLMVMQALVHHTNLFNAYVSIDPSMWWSQESLLKETGKIMKTKKFNDRSLFLGIANTLDGDTKIEKVSKDSSYATKHIRSILKLRDLLEASKNSGLKFKAKYYSDEDHGSVPLIAEYDALRFFFSYYPMKLSFKDLTDSTTGLAEKYEKHYSYVSQQLGYKVKPNEDLINGMGYQALASRQFKKAERFLKINVDNYPNSGNVYDSYGDYYEAVGDKTNAMIYFQKALAVAENADTRKKLEKLQYK